MANYKQNPKKKKMDTFAVFVKFDSKKHFFEKVQCDNCSRVPNKIYKCEECSYSCEKCVYFDTSDSSGFSNCHCCSEESWMSEILHICDTENPKPKEIIITKTSSNCSHSENGCKEEFLAQKAHEMTCPYQKVSCPKLDCKDMQKPKKEKMDSFTVLVKNEFKEEFLEKFQCYNCNTDIPNKIYICPKCENFNCEKCVYFDTSDSTGYCTCNACGNEGWMSELFQICDTENPKPKEIIITKTSSNCSYSENGCKEEFLAQKAHEMTCPHQKVKCPELNCKEHVIFKDMDNHLDQVHKIQRSKEEWDFEGTKDELVKNICSLTKYNKQFFPKMYIKDDYLYFKVIMLGHQENVMYSKACFTFFQDNGQQISKDDNVYSITEKHEEHQFSNESLKKLTEYYDLKSFEKKQHGKIKFNLKITNAKLDEIAKDKAIVMESLDSDG